MLIILLLSRSNSSLEMGLYLIPNLSFEIFILVEPTPVCSSVRRLDLDEFEDLEGIVDAVVSVVSFGGLVSWALQVARLR